MNNILKILLTIALLSIVSVNIDGQHKKAYQIFDASGNKSNYKLMFEQAITNNVILFGELHNNPICHWLQYELTKDIHSIAGNNLIIGAEMFEADNQLIINEYLEGLISERNFNSEAKLWSNYETDYKPVFEYAKDNGLSFVATNIPRRYAAMVNRGGFEALKTLSEKALSYIAPLPVEYDPELPGYKQMLEMSQMPAHVSENLPKAQAVKDATMAHFINKNLADDTILLHLHGTYHSNNYEGIVWYLNNIDEEMKIMTISTVEQTEIEALDGKNHGLADFIIVITDTMTKTY